MRVTESLENVIKYGFRGADMQIKLKHVSVARMGEERGVYRVLVRKPEGKRPLGRPRRRWG